MTLAIIIIATCGLGYRFAVWYIARAQRSFASADRVWADLRDAVRSFVEQDVPPAVAQLTIQLAAITGCGCFVRGALIGHFLPQLRPNRSGGKVLAAFEEAAAMPTDRQQAFGRIVAMSIVYDSFRNPIQGWLFRRVLRSLTRAQPSWVDQAEARMTAFSVMARQPHMAR